MYKVDTLSQGKRLNSTSDEDLIVDSSENVYVFVKEGFVKKSNSMSLFDDIEEPLNTQAIDVGTTTKYERKKPKEVESKINFKVNSLW